MDNKYGHMIYTRRGCGRTIDGREDNKDGYGIYYMTSNVANPSEKLDRDFLEKVIGEMWNVDSYM